MNPGSAHNIDSLFGPPSDLIDIAAFLEAASAIDQDEGEPGPPSVAEECSLEDIRNSVRGIWSHPTQSAHLIKDHEHTVNALYGTANPKHARSSRKAHLLPPHSLPIEVTNLQTRIDSIALSSYRLNTDAVHFIRTPKNSDHNVLLGVKPSSSPDIVCDSRQAVLIISIHNRIPWGPSYVTRSSQHAVISSQTLQDLYQVMPCSSKSIPAESSPVLEAQGFAEGGFAFCIEDLVYGDGCGESENDYASKLLSHLQNKGNRPSIAKAPMSTRDTKFSSLALRIGEPYWLIHGGNCEHFIVIDQIRLIHPSDPRSGYPLTLQITPILLDLCRACTKVPAVWSIVGDVRLGESPCALCEPCWKSMGTSQEDGVVVLHLPDYNC